MGETFFVRSRFEFRDLCYYDARTTYYKMDLFSRINP